MRNLVQIESADRELLARVSEAMAEAVRRSGTWVVCRPGCTQCCHGPFAISRLDAMRLRAGMKRLDPARAAAVRKRVAAYVAAVMPVYPGDAVTGSLLDEDAFPIEWEEVACPALDPTTGSCDLYDSRPVTCRVFGPVTRMEDGSLGACELCYDGATEEEMERCAVEVDPEGFEAELIAKLPAGATIVAFALRDAGGE